MSEFLELEYKYRADNISLTQFNDLLAKQKITKKLDVSSWDTYFTKGPDEFVRFRNSNISPELTIKRKMKDRNNWQRVEVDLPLDPKRLTDEKADNFLTLLEYKKNFKIYKSCFIYWLDDVNYVYYIVYDENLKECGRFIEVEINKESITSLSNSVEALNRHEKTLSSLGISPQNRLKKSLFEMYVKG